MKIDGPNSARGLQAPRRAQGPRTAGATAFSLDAAGEAAEPAAPAATTSTAPLASIESLLALQGTGERTQGRARAIDRAERLLEGLDALRGDILAGAVPRRRLEDLSRLARDRREAVDDPRLALVLEEIDLRARVELAKLERAG